MPPPAPIRRVCLAVVLSIATACQPPPQPASRLGAVFSDLHARGLFDGAVVVSGDRGAFAHGYGYADEARRVPFTPDTPTDGASLAKTFTATLLIGLQEEGRLRLDDPAQRLLPELPYPGITLGHLISHASGLPVRDYDYFDPFLPRDQVRTTDLLLRVLAEQKPPLDAPPGTAFEYNSFGFDLAALAAARAAGTSYTDLLAARIFRPLGITSAFVRPGRLKDFPGVRTLGYRRVDGRLEPNDVFDLEGFHGGSNVYISARDLDRWSRSFLDAPLLDARGLSLAHEPALIGTGHSGLTWGSWYRSPDVTAFWYSGHLQGFHAEVFRDTKSESSVVYASNNTLEPWLQKAIVREVSAVLNGSEPTRLMPPALDAVGAGERASLAGRWTFAPGEALVIERAGDALMAVRDEVRYRIVPVSREAFYVPGLDFVLGFAKDGSGTFGKIYLSTNVEERWGTRASAPPQ